MRFRHGYVSSVHQTSRCKMDWAFGTLHVIHQLCLLPILLPFDGGDNPCSVVILDNASIHHVEAVTQLISATGALVQFLPPYSPDLNPIEEAFRS